MTIYLRNKDYRKAIGTAVLLKVHQKNRSKILLPFGRLRYFHVAVGPALSAGPGGAPLEFLLAWLEL